MNLAFTTGPLFILPCIFLVGITVADPLIDVSPSEINLGITSTLHVNCTFSLNNHPDIAALISLVLSRANATGQHFQDLATITEFAPNSASLFTQENVSATGVLSQTGESFLHITWEYPTALQVGVYQCSAHGLNDIGYNVEMVNTSLVTVDTADLNYVFEKLKEIEMHEASMTNTISMMGNRIQTLENITQTLESDKLSLKHNISRLEVVVASITGPHVDFLGSHGTADYFVSSYAFTDINSATDVCKSLGGQLAVVNDQNELAAMQGFLKATSGIADVYIAGSDEQAEGNWVLPHSNTQLPFTSWASGRPANDRSSNCLVLRTYSSWSMNDNSCHYDIPTDSYRFMCEIQTM